MAALILLSDQQCTDKTSFGCKEILVHAWTFHISPYFSNILCHNIVNLAHYNIIRYSDAFKGSPYFTIFHQHITKNFYACSLLILQMLIFADHLISWHIIVNFVHYDIISIDLTKYVDVR